VALGVLAGCGDSSEPDPPRDATLAARLHSWSDASLAYASTIAHCSRQPTPLKGYWRSCTGTERRAYERATTRVRAAKASASKSGRCGDLADRAVALVDETTAALARDSRANQALLRAAEAGRHYRGPSVPELDVRTQATASQLADNAGRLADGIGRDCG
jgi:hypothetical protein